MIILLEWLKEFLETDLTINEIVDNFEKTGFSVENFYIRSESLKNIKIVKILEKHKHPNADKLNLYKIVNFENVESTIVCGDSSLSVGNYVPYAAPGTFIPLNNFQIKTVKIRGIESPGMLCSSKEMMLPFDKNGVLVCDPADFGKSIFELYDDVIEIETTPNKGNMLSIQGVANHLSYNFAECKLKPLNLFNTDNIPEKKLFNIKNNNCSALSALSFRMQPAETKSYIKKRLQLIKINPTNLNFADLTNYVAHEIGQPMHAFDHDKIDGKEIIYQSLEKPENFETLGGQSIILEQNSLVFKDKKKIISWPGIIGGQNSKITSESENILIESGIFKIDSLQRRKNKIQTSAAKKFECGTNYENPEIAIKRFLYLLNDKFEVTGKQNFYFKPEKKILFNPTLCKKILNIEYSTEYIKQKLLKQNFKVEEQNGLLLIEPSSEKYFQIETENCIIEEIAEVDKIDAIPLSYKKIKQEKGNLQIKSCALNSGFFEVYNFSLQEEQKDFDAESKQVKVANFDNINYSHLRISLIPGILKIIQWHQNNNYNYKNFFEIGEIYKTESQETIFTAICESFEKIHHLLSLIFQSNQLVNPDFEENSLSYYQDGMTIKQNNNAIGYIGKIKTTITEKYGLKNYFALELKVDLLKNLKKFSYEKPGKQMPIYKDLCFKLHPNLMISNLLKEMEKEQKCYITDVYPNPILNTEKNVTLRFIFESDETLNNEQINEKLENIKITALEKFNIKTL